VRKVLHTGWKLQAFKTQTLQDVRLRYAFAKDTMERMYEDKVFLVRLAFTEGAPFHDRHKVTAWGSEQPHVFTRPDPVCCVKQFPWNFNAGNLLRFVNEVQLKMLHVSSRHNLYNIISIYI